jgi:hypothetical protein
MIISYGESDNSINMWYRNAKGVLMFWYTQINNGPEEEWIANAHSLNHVRSSGPEIIYDSGDE